MDNELMRRFNELSSKDDNIRMEALHTILHMTDEKVDWVYEVWEDLLQKLVDENSYQRSIAIMVLCNLAKSDGENRMSEVINRLLSHTRDEKFITSRQCLQNVWKVAVVNPALKDKVIVHLEEQYINCTGDKHYNLIRQDIIQSLKFIFDADGDEMLLAKLQKLLQLENDLKNRKKYGQILIR